MLHTQPEEYDVYCNGGGVETRARGRAGNEHEFERQTTVDNEKCQYTSELVCAMREYCR